METNLTSFYDTLKSNLNSDRGTTAPTGPAVPIGGLGNSPIAGRMNMPNDIVLRRRMNACCDKLKDDCRKHILLDIYVKILPLDDKFKCGNMGMMKHDIDCMLQNKGMSATQYLTSCSESTKAPLLDYLMRSTDIIGRQYLKEAEEQIKADAANGINTPEPKQADVNDAEVQDQLIDIKKDPEYETFVDKLKEKTIKKIVSDVSDLISDKKSEQKMSFDTGATTNTATTPATTDTTQASTASDNTAGAVAESTVGTGIDYLQKHFDLTEASEDDVMGLAIREATLHQFDVVFNQPGKEFKEYASKIFYGKGILINESCEMFTEKSKNTSKENQDDTFTIYGSTFEVPEIDGWIDRDCKDKLNDSFKIKAREKFINCISKEKNIVKIEHAIYKEENDNSSENKNTIIARIEKYLSKSKVDKFLCAKSGKCALKIDIPYIKNVSSAWIEHEMWITSDAEVLPYDDIEFMK